MNDIMCLILANLEKVSIGAILFLLAYLANIGLGAWRNVSLEGYEFDWMLIRQSAIKFMVLGFSIALLSMVVSILPAYAMFIGIEIGAETLETIDSIVIVGAFLFATIRYIVDAIGKLKAILGVE